MASASFNAKSGKRVSPFPHMMHGIHRSHVRIMEGPDHPDGIHDLVDLRQGVNMPAHDHATWGHVLCNAAKPRLFQKWIDLGGNILSATPDGLTIGHVAASHHPCFRIWIHACQSQGVWDQVKDVSWKNMDMAGHGGTIGHLCMQRRYIPSFTTWIIEGGDIRALSRQYGMMIWDEALHHEETGMALLQGLAQRNDRHQYLPYISHRLHSVSMFRTWMSIGGMDVPHDHMKTFPDHIIEKNNISPPQILQSWIMHGGNIFDSSMRPEIIKAVYCDQAPKSHPCIVITRSLIQRMGYEVPYAIDDARTLLALRDPRGHAMARACISCIRDPVVMATWICDIDRASSQEWPAS